MKLAAPISTKTIKLGHDGSNTDSTSASMGRDLCRLSTLVRAGIVERGAVALGLLSDFNPTDHNRPSVRRSIAANVSAECAWVAGLYLAWAGHWLSAGWLHAKLLLVLVLSGVHGFFPAA
jgi:hypothetical protein